MGLSTAWIAVSSMQEEQDAAGGDDADVDYLFEVPILLAAAVVGYRYDRVALESGGEPRFTLLAPAAP